MQAKGDVASRGSVLRGMAPAADAFEAASDALPANRGGCTGCRWKGLTAGRNPLALCRTVGRERNPAKFDRAFYTGCKTVKRQKCKDLHPGPAA